MTLQELLAALSRYWADQGCVLPVAYDLEVAAGTMHPDAFFRALGPEPWRAAFVQPTRRPSDGRYAQNPHRAQRYYQFQVLLKPSPDDVQDTYLESLRCLGIDPRQHDLRFVEDDWEVPTLGASGVGWEVWLDGMEITQFTYFQQVGGLSTRPVSVELTYGPERLAMLLQRVESIWELEWAPGIRYAELGFHAETPCCRYNFDVADTERLSAWFAGYEAEALLALEQGLLLPAYDYTLKCSHTLNLLDSRGALSMAERAATIERVRLLARRCAEAYLSQREALGFPLLARPAAAATE
ncbi:MAG: glycine--tRNA ligase subunit alpha [Armatimonadetes bacterium]|nr:glycine--tRNA ligase subunit alpha [Armatimonadota bacterium]